MNALQQLTSLAGETLPADHAGLCGVCGRGMYWQQTPPGMRTFGSVERVREHCCRSCYQRTAQRCAFCRGTSSTGQLCKACTRVWDAPGVLQVAQAG
jgi:hypothetical protein